MMKTFRIFTFALTLCGTSFLNAQEAAQPAELSWHTQEASAREEAAQLGRPLLIFFTAGWCHYCHLMEKETLQKPEVRDYLAKHVVLFRADYDGQKDLVARYRVRGVPALVIGDPTLSKIEQSSGLMPVDVFLAWAESSAEKVSPKAIAEADAASRQFVADMSRSFRNGLTEDQYGAITEFFTLCGKKDPRALEFAKNHLKEEVQHHPGRFCRYLKNKQLHVRILTSNAFAQIYGSEFPFDPWDLGQENQARLEVFLKEKEISSLLEDLIDF